MIKFDILDSKLNITVADSFVKKNNKIGQGSGEARLYAGPYNDENKTFFGKLNSENNAVVEKRHLLEYLKKAKYEYIYPSYDYHGKLNMETYYNELCSNIESLYDIIYFSIEYALDNDNKVRCYVRDKNARAKDSVFSILRSMLLPNISYINIYKVKDKDKKIKFLFIPFMSTLYDNNHHQGMVSSYISEINNDKKITVTEKEALIKARIGQGKFRENLLNEHPACYVTNVTEPKLLIASHIKPWYLANNTEKLDIHNGLLLTPTFDKLFDQGLITFTSETKMLISNILDKKTIKLLKLNNYSPKIISYKERKQYLEYHNDEIFIKI